MTDSYKTLFFKRCINRVSVVTNLFGSVMDLLHNNIHNNVQISLAKSDKLIFWNWKTQLWDIVDFPK